MKHLALVLTMLLAACTDLRPVKEPICGSDEECGEGKVCFAEGCGDPGKGIVVEIEGGSLTGQFARDFAIPTGSLGANQGFELGAPLSINGQFQRELTATINPLDRTSYTDAVVVRAVGQSALLPGITRTFEARFDRPERGFFEMKVGAGDFNITATPADRAVPPVVTAAQIQPNVTSASINFAFPAIDGAPALAGQLIRKLDTALLPPEPVLVSEAFMKVGAVVPVVELQLFDPKTNLPLSQRFPIGSTGEFAITVSPEARNQPSLLLIAAPREPGVAIPTKRFLLATPLPTAISLEYGEYGDAAEVKGTILDSTGTPVAGAQVVIEGTVGGDGSFRSKIVETNAVGEFRATTLGSKTDGSFQLTVVPPRGSRAAYTQRPVTVKVAGQVATLSPERITLEDRLIAHGVVSQPSENKPGVGVTVHATLQLETMVTGEARALPVEPAEAVTGADGTFELPLDPGIWRFEYFPADRLPISSRLVTVQPVIDAKTGLKLPTIDLRPVQLSFGRTVSGVVTGTMGTKVGEPVPYSQLRFFRVTTVEGRPASILLGSTIADDRGRYTLVLPTVSTPVDAGTPAP